MIGPNIGSTLTNRAAAGVSSKIGTRASAMAWFSAMRPVVQFDELSGQPSIALERGRTNKEEATTREIFRRSGVGVAAMGKRVSISGVPSAWRRGAHARSLPQAARHPAQFSSLPAGSSVTLAA